ncbi:MAG: dTMP kinase [Clostridia bacterium]|nr:dTMP kinase [Clostridia bacterium]
MKGKFIVIEGLDGSGKSSIAKDLTKLISEKTGASCLYEREPYDEDPAGKVIRASLAKELSIEPETMAFLNVASRIEHIHHLKPILDGGTSVVCDRYYLSNMAYNQTDALSMEAIYDLNRVCLDMLKPDLVLFLNVSIEESRKRRAKDATRGQAELYETDTVQLQVRNRFGQILDFLQDKETIVTIDASKDYASVLETVWAAVQTVF